MWWPSALSRRPEEPRDSAASGGTPQQQPVLAGDLGPARDPAPVRRPPDD